MTLGVWAPGELGTAGRLAMAEIPLLDLPNYPDDRTEWLEALSNNLGVLALNARVSTVLGPKVSLSARRAHLDRDVALLRVLVEKTNAAVGDPEQRRLERFDTQRAEEESLRHPDRGA